MLYLKIIGNYAMKIFKNKYFWYLIIISLLILYFIKNVNNKREIERLNLNSKALNQSINVLKSKNNELFYSVNALTLQKDEFKDANGELNKMLSDMKIKLKNVQSITQMNINYKKLIDKLNSKELILKDTIYLPKDNLKPNLLNYISKYSFNNKNDDSNVSGLINIPTSYDLNNKNYLLNKNYEPYISDLTIEISDTITVVPTINYKRVWLFFKRPKSVTVYVKSENLLFNLEQIKTYQINK